MFCRSLFVLLYFFFWPLCCLFFDLHILITPLVSSNSSYYIRRAASPEEIKLVVFYYLIVFEIWPEKRVGLYWEWSYSLFRTFGHLTIEGGESSKNPWDFAFYLNFNGKFDFYFFYFGFEFWCFNATFSNISAISWRPVLVVEEVGENH